MVAVALPAVAGAQQNSLAHWETVGYPIAPSAKFGLAVGAGQRPILVYVDENHVIFRQWDSSKWASIRNDNYEGQNVDGVRIAGIRSPKTFAAVHIRSQDLNSSRVSGYILNGADITPLSSALQIPTASSAIAVAIDASGPLVAWTAGGIVRVSRWEKEKWVQLGSSVNSQTIIVQDPPTLTVTSEGKIVVAYAGSSGVMVSAWTGGVWGSLGNASVPGSGSRPMLSATSDGAPVLVSLIGQTANASVWNGTAWVSSGRVCTAFLGVLAFERIGSEIHAICGESSSQGFTLKAYKRARPPLNWIPVGKNSVSGTTPASGSYGGAAIQVGVAGQPWVAWNSGGGAYPDLIVSRLIPPAKKIALPK